MNGTALAAARQRLGLTTDQMAAELGLPPRRVPVVGPYLAGTVAVFGYLLAILALVTVLDGERAPSFGADILVFALAVSILLGGILGHRLFRGPETGPAGAARAD